MTDTRIYKAGILSLVNPPYLFLPPWIYRVEVAKDSMRIISLLKTYEYSWKEFTDSRIVEIPTKVGSQRTCLVLKTSDGKKFKFYDYYFRNNKDLFEIALPLKCPRVKYKQNYLALLVLVLLIPCRAFLQDEKLELLCLLVVLILYSAFDNWLNAM